MWKYGEKSLVNSAHHGFHEAGFQKVTIHIPGNKYVRTNRWDCLVYEGYCIVTV